jgi:hypothetical protein
LVRVIQHVQDQAQRGFSFARVGGGSPPPLPGGGQVRPDRRVDPARTPSPIGPGEHAAEAARRRERPEGVIENAPAGGGGKFSFGSVGR